MQVLEKLIQLLQKSSVYNPDSQSRPTCILWPDKESQFESIIPELQKHLPELFVLGEYVPEKRMGPSIWLRCVLENTIKDIELADDVIPILYLPKVGRQDLRAVESCEEHLKPLAELQYRGVIWSQINSKDWTILSLLKSDQGGFSLDVAQDAATKDAMKLALSNFLEEEIDLLDSKRLDKDYFNALLSGGDPIKGLLTWLNEGESYVEKRSEDEWNAFNQVCKSQFGFMPKDDGQLAAAEQLALHNGVWLGIWERYCEAPNRYKNIPNEMRKCKMPSFDLFAEADEKGKWPQWNDEEEARLLQSLIALNDKPAHKVREDILVLEKEHSIRRTFIWSELKEAQLANVLLHLAQLAAITKESLAAGTIDDIFASYTTKGYKADDAVLRALEIVDVKYFEAVSIAIRAMYLPWAEENARHLQKVVSDSTYPGETIETATKQHYKDGDCILFVDGLRFDTAKRLLLILEERGLKVKEKSYWNPLPSVTATGKPSVSPVRDMIKGIEENENFEPSVAETGQSLKGGYHLKKLLTDSKWKILERNDNGDGVGNAWCEFGDIDHEGHDRGWKLAKHIDNLLNEIAGRIEELSAAGWKEIKVVTDHGWLLMPKGLPKIELPSALTNSKWGRCAVLKAGVQSKEKTFPWYWNTHQYFALADGISCFKKGDEYNHGGLSVQECIVLEMSVCNENASSSSNTVELTDIVWKGLRCTVAIDGESEDLKIDIRTNAGDKNSSIVLSTKKLKSNGTASVVVEDEDKEGEKAFIVVVDNNGSLVQQTTTVIGGE